MHYIWLTWCRALCARGNINFTRFKRYPDTWLKITSDRPDLHSGIEGGAVVEPMVDMFV